LLKNVWGEVRTSGEDKKKQMAEWQAKLTPGRLESADLKRGHDLFLKVCGVCHRLYGEGASIGPDLTGSGRTHVDYLLENILDPGAVVPQDYRLSVVELKDERVLSGVVVERKAKTITVQTANEKVTVPRDEIQSMLDSLKEDEVRDLIGTRRHKASHDACVGWSSGTPQRASGTA
jgi:putative heme-binding domain-containing protein